MDSIDVEALLASLPARISDIPAALAARAPHHVLLIEDGREMTALDLFKAIDTTVVQFTEAGVKSGDRVMIVAENSIAQIVLMFAAATLDAWALLTNARLSGTEIDAIRNHARPRMIAFGVESSTDASTHAERLGAQPAESCIGAWSFLMDHSVSAEPVETSAALQCAALIYTTGTTGAPKGVMLSHRNLLFIAAISSTLRRVSERDVVYAVLPISHVYGLASVCLGSLYAGATLRLAPRFAPDLVLKALADENVSVFQGVPAMHAKLLERVHASGKSLAAPSLRFVYSGGSPLDPALKARAEATYNLPVHNGYGMTESSPTISQTMLDAPRDDCAAGDPIPGIEIRFVSLEGSDVLPGEVGELWVRGPNVMLGYYRNDAQTRATVTENGWLRTGDLGRLADDGALHIVGRSKELIIRSGFNVYPAEVENVLNAHPDILQSAVIGRAVEGNEEVIAFVELLPTVHSLPVDMNEWCAARLAPYKRPAEIRVLAALPAASTGKLLKHKLHAEL